MLAVKRKEDPLKIFSGSGGLFYKDFPNILPAAKHHNDVIGLQYCICSSLGSVTILLFYHHDHDVVFRHDFTFSERYFLQNAGDLMKKNMGNYHVSIVLQENNGIGIRAKHDPVADTLNPSVKLGFEIGAAAQQMKGCQYSQQDGDPDKKRFQFSLSQGHKEVYGGGYNGYGKSIAKEHGGPGQTAADLIGDNSFAFPGGEAGVCQKRNDLESGFFFSHPRKPKENRDNIGDYDIDNDEKRKQDQRTGPREASFRKQLGAAEIA